MSVCLDTLCGGGAITLQTRSVGEGLLRSRPPYKNRPRRQSLFLTSRTCFKSSPPVASSLSLPHPLLSHRSQCVSGTS
jgi:hypothetical protein